MKRIDIKQGHRFNRLTVIHEAEQRKNARHFLCKCDCGKENMVALGRLRSGMTKSCGCLHSEITAARNQKHGLCGTRLYRTWGHMMGRCNNPADARYVLYGGRGIKVCDEWQNFHTLYEWAMANGYSHELTIDRKDGDGHYEPNNCRWATWKQQQNNRRNNNVITHKGKTLTLQQWSDATGILAGTIRFRLNNGWTPADALETATRKSAR